MRCRLSLALILLTLPAAGAEPLTTCGQVRGLPEGRAAEALPVRLVATIVHVDRGTTLFVQDDTGATFLSLARTPFAGSDGFRSGSRIRAEGVTHPGLFVVGVRPATIEVIGTAELPPPVPVTAAELASGRRHYSRIAIDGTVRAVGPVDEAGISTLRLMTDGGPVEVRVAGPLPAGLVEARVDVVGLAAGAINDRRQLVRPYVAALPADVTVRVPPPPNAVDRPPVPARDLLRFDPGREDGRRVRVRGVVTHHQPGVAVFLRDGTDAIEVESTQAGTLAPGDVVEALGFPRAGPFRAVLADAVFVVVGQADPPEPRDATPDEARRGIHEADLIRLIGDIVEAYPGEDGDVIAVRADDVRFRVLAPAGAARDLAPGSRVAVVGIARVTVLTEGGYSLRPTGLELRARSADDLRVLARPPWWTPGRLLVALATVGAMAAVAVLWAAILRRQVRRQTATIREQFSREAAAEERQRIAREVHDTLEQELTGLALQLDAARATAARSGDVPPAFDVARRLVGRLHEEVRALVWDLRETPTAGLHEALAAVADRAGGPPVSVATEGDPWPLPAEVRHHLARLVQEAVTNALKHADASAVTVTARYTPATLRVEVADDGRGFADEPTEPGHYGLTGMRERARKIGATLTVESATGQGTTVAVTVPRPAEEGRA